MVHGPGQRMPAQQSVLLRQSEQKQIHIWQGRSFGAYPIALAYPTTTFSRYRSAKGPLRVEHSKSSSVTRQVLPTWERIPSRCPRTTNGRPTCMTITREQKHNSIAIERQYDCKV